jgi:hypothetical protein
MCSSKGCCLKDTTYLVGQSKRYHALQVVQRLSLQQIAGQMTSDMDKTGTDSITHHSLPST